MTFLVFTALWFLFGWVFGPQVVIFRSYSGEVNGVACKRGLDLNMDSNPHSPRPPGRNEPRGVGIDSLATRNSKQHGKHEEQDFLVTVHLHLSFKTGISREL